MVSLSSSEVNFSRTRERARMMPKVARAATTAKMMRVVRVFFFFFFFFESLRLRNSSSSLSLTFPAGEVFSI